MGHTDVIEHPVVDSERPAVILVEITKECIQPSGVARSGHQSQVGRHHTEKLLRVSGPQSDFHQVTDGLIAEYELLHHDLFGNSEIRSNPLVTRELGLVATHAIVDEVPGPTLQGLGICQVQDRKSTRLNSSHVASS